MPDFLEGSHKLFEYTRALRRDFHRHPELGFEEIRTASIVARELNDLGLEVSTGIGKTGVVALLEGEQPGLVVLVRFDMDALPIQEATGAEYASEVPGVMHACGHDGHTAVGLTVARLLNEHRREFQGTVKLVFQPAEEGLGGAEAMIADGVLQDPRPDLSLSLHLWNDKPLGWIGVTPGPVMASADIFNIRLFGRGGHAAQPHLANDPLIPAAQIITALQSIVSRHLPPLESGVVSVTTLRAGEAFNVIPEFVEMKGTIRTFKPEIRSLILERFQQIVSGIAASFGCQVEMDVKSITPAVINDPQVSAFVQETIMDLVKGSDLDTGMRTMGSEDMAFMMQEIPGCYFFVGSANSEKGLDAPHHHPGFDVDEESLPLAAAIMAASVAKILESQGEHAVK